MHEDHRTATYKDGNNDFSEPMTKKKTCRQKSSAEISTGLRLHLKKELS